MASDCNFIAVRWHMLGSNDGLFVNVVKKLWVPWNVENFLSSVSLISSSRRILFHGQANCLIIRSYYWVWNEAAKFHIECHKEQDIWVGYINVRYTCLVEVFWYILASDKILSCSLRTCHGVNILFSTLLVLNYFCSSWWNITSAVVLVYKFIIK
jgi:hypothetical protein